MLLLHLNKKNEIYRLALTEYTCSLETRIRDNLFPEDLAQIKLLFNKTDILLDQKTSLFSEISFINTTLNTIQKKLMVYEFEELFVDTLQILDPVTFTEAVIECINNLTRIASEMKKDCFLDQQEEYYPLTPKEAHLLSRHNIREMYKAYDYILQYKMTNTANQKIYEFLRKAYEITAKRFNNLNSSKQLLDKLQEQEQNLTKIHEATLEGIEILEDAFLTNDAETFANIINDAATFLNKLYIDKRTKEILVCLRFLKSKDLYTIFRYLETNHDKAIKRWFINYYLDHHSIPKFKSLKTSKQNEEFKNKCYKQLNIEAADAIDPRIETISEQNADVLFASIRILANKKTVKIQTYELLIEYLAKHYNVAEKPELLPTKSDSKSYHTLYKIMQAIWHSYIAGHVFSVLLDNIKINDFRLEWEGAYGNTMLGYLRRKYLEITIKYTDPIIYDIKKELIENLESAILFDRENSSKWLEDRLQADQIIAIDVHLYDENHMAGHAVSAIFWKNIVLFSDRGRSLLGELSGIDILQINNLDAKKRIIRELIASKEISISSKAYNTLREQLNLRPLHQIPMLPQFKGNCSFSSSAEPIHLGIVFLCFLKIFLKKHKSWQDACSLAEENSLTLHKYIMQKVYYMTFTNLVDFFNESKGELDFPKELLAHIHILNTYRIQNHQISTVTLTLIPEKAKIKAYEDYKKYFIDNINDSLPGPHNAQLIPQKLKEYGLHFIYGFLNDNLEQEDLRKLAICIKNSLIFGDRKISPMMLMGEFDLILPFNQANIEEIEEPENNTPHKMRNKIV